MRPLSQAPTETLVPFFKTVTTWQSWLAKHHAHYNAKKPETRAKLARHETIHSK